MRPPWGLRPLPPCAMPTMCQDGLSHTSWPRPKESSFTEEDAEAQSQTLLLPHTKVETESREIQTLCHPYPGKGKDRMYLTGSLAQSRLQTPGKHQVRSRNRSKPLCSFSWPGPEAEGRVLRGCAKGSSWGETTRISFPQSAWRHLVTASYHCRSSRDLQVPEVQETTCKKSSEPGARSGLKNSEKAPLQV